MGAVGASPVPSEVAESAHWTWSPNLLTWRYGPRRRRHPNRSRPPWVGSAARATGPEPPERSPRGSVCRSTAGWDLRCRGAGRDGRRGCGHGSPFSASPVLVASTLRLLGARQSVDRLLQRLTSLLARGLAVAARVRRALQRGVGHADLAQVAAALRRGEPDAGGLVLLARCADGTVHAIAVAQQPLGPGTCHDLFRGVHGLVTRGKGGRRVRCLRGAAASPPRHHHHAPRRWRADPAGDGSEEAQRA
jgi:hypothetical protein